MFAQPKQPDVRDIWVVGWMESKSNQKHVRVFDLKHHAESFVFDLRAEKETQAVSIWNMYKP